VSTLALRTCRENLEFRLTTPSWTRQLCTNSQLAERVLARLQQFFVDLNDQLQDQGFIAAQRFSIANITSVVAVDFAHIVRSSQMNVILAGEIQCAKESVERKSRAAAQEG